MDRFDGLAVVVTGGAGFIGSHLTEQIVGEGPASVAVIDDLSTGTAENLARVRQYIDFVKGDVCNPAVAQAAAGADVVFHLAVRNVRASIKRPLENFGVNANGTLEVLEAMRRGARGRFVYVSSSEVYGVPPSGEFREDVACAPTTVYGAGKLAGELIALAYHRTYGMKTQVVRPFNTFGPRSHFEGDSGEVIPKFVLRALAGKPLLVHGDGAQTRDFSYVSDTARWLLALATTEEAVGEIVNIGAGQDMAILDVARKVLAATGSASEVVHVDPRPGDLPRLCADVRKVASMLPFRASVGFSRGLDETIRHFSSADIDLLLSKESERNWM